MFTNDETKQTELNHFILATGTTDMGRKLNDLNLLLKEQKVPAACKVSTELMPSELLARQPLKTIRRWAAVVGIGMVWLSILIASEASGQVVATWTGAGNGTHYGDPLNWSTGVVPINNGGTTYNVVVANSRNITFDVPGSISGISYGTGGSITMASGVAFNVNSVASLGSNIFADGAGTSFIANGLGVVLESNVRLNASNGAAIATSSGTYNRTSNGNLVVAHANGAGALVQNTNMSSIVNSTSNSANAGGWATFLAENQGVLDYSNVQTISGGGSSVYNSSGNIFTIRTGGNIDFSNLQTISRLNTFNVQVPNYSLPALTNANGVTLNIDSNATIELPSLTTLDGSQFNVAAGAHLNAASLTTFTNSGMTLVAGNNINTGQLLNINNSRFQVLGGRQLVLPGQEYIRNNIGTFNAFRVDGVGSRIEMTNGVRIQNSTPIGLNQGGNTSFIAENGGYLDFSKVKSITGGAVGVYSSSINIFTMRTNGLIDLSDVETISNRNSFNIEIPTFSMPELRLLNGTSLNLAVGTSFSTPKLEQIQAAAYGSAVTIPIFASWNASQLSEINNLSINISVGGTFSAPNATTFQNSTVAIQPGVVFQTANLFNIDNSRFTVLGGSQLTLNPMAYNSTINQSVVAFRADGINSRISAPSMTSISKTNAGTTSFIAENSGRLDFSSVNSIAGSTSGPNAFVARTGGRIELGAGNVLRRNSFSIDGAGSVIKFDGLNVNTTSTTVAATNLGTLEVAGSLSHVHTAEANFNLDNGRVWFKDVELAELEIAGQNLGTNTNGLGNFGFQQMRVGTFSTPTTLVLADNFNNGNRTNGMSEVQYLLDVTGDGLVMDPNSRIVLNGHDLLISNGQDSFVSVRSLFEPGFGSIEYGQGIISLTGEAGEILNRGFENCDVNTRSATGWKNRGPGVAQVIQNPRPARPANCAMEMTAGSEIEISQQVSTLDEAFFLSFDAFAQDSSGLLELLLDDIVLETWDWNELGLEDYLRMTVRVDDPTMLGQIDIPLTLRWNADTGHRVLLDDINMMAVPEAGSSLLFAAIAMGITLRRRRDFIELWD